MFIHETIIAFFDYMLILAANTPSEDLFAKVLDFTIMCPLITLFMFMFPPMAIYSLVTGFSNIWRINFVVPNWPSVPGEIIKSDISSITRINHWRNLNKKVETYTAAICFKYYVEGKEYISDKFTWGGSLYSNDLKWIEGRQAKRLIGKQRTVLYNPKNPTDCIIDTSASFEQIIPILVGIAFVIITTALWVFMPMGIVYDRVAHYGSTWNHTVWSGFIKKEHFQGYDSKGHPIYRNPMGPREKQE